jgi:hypothetical protein
MRRIKAVDLLGLTVDEIWGLDDGLFELEFEDKVIETNTRRTIYSWYYWRLHTQYPQAPLLSRHHIGDRIMTPGVHLELCSAVAWDVYFAMEDVVVGPNGEMGVDRMEISKTIYDITSDIYNDFTANLEAFVTTVNILDFIDIVDHPKIKEINDNVKPTEVSVMGAYDDIKDVLLGDEALKENNVRRFSVSKLVSIDQLNQALGPRGFVTDVDSNIFRNPILVGYVEGFKDLHDSMIESRSGTKSLMLQKDPLGKSQYFNRRMQLGCTFISKLDYTDCGSDQYVPFMVNDERDLNALNGKWYMPKGEGSTLKAISTTNKELIGTTVRLRSSITCHHKHADTICSTCMGLLSLSVPPKTNIGHVASTELCAQVSQAVLSTKHLDKTSILEVLELVGAPTKYLVVSENTGDVYVRDNVDITNLSISLPLAYINHIGDIFSTENIDQLAITRVTKIPNFTLEVKHGEDSKERMETSTLLDSTPASISKEFLKYMREFGWTDGDDDDIVIDLKHWNKDEPCKLFSFPRKHTSMLDFMLRISTIIQSGDTSSDSRGSSRRADAKLGFQVLSDFDSASGALSYLHQEVSSKLNVNIAHLEIIIRSTLIRSASEGDHRLPLPHHNLEFGKYRDNMQSRSMAAQLAYEYHGPALLNVSNYVNTNRPDHPMDTILKG